MLNKTDVLELCSGESKNTEWSFDKMTNLKIFAASLKDVPMSCMEAFLPKLLLKNHTVTCLIFREVTGRPYKDNLGIFLLLFSICMETKSWKKKYLKFSI